MLRIATPASGSLGKMAAFAVLSALAVLATGCGNMATTALSATPDGGAASLVGDVHGGNQRIAFATVKLYSVGLGGYGSSGTLFATTSTANDGYGSFSFTKGANTKRYGGDTDLGATCEQHCRDQAVIWRGSYRM
jgi:hypothetical protein